MEIVSGLLIAASIPAARTAGGKRESKGAAVEILRRSWQFQHVYRCGKKINCTSAVVFYLQDEETIESLCIGVVASKRVGNAVMRNRAKRLLREVSKKIIDRLNNKKMWMVLIARPAILETNYRDILSEVENGLAKAGLLAREQ